jgi:hypothetical protein
MPAATLAALAHPSSWKQVSDDGRYVLVMVSPLPVDEDARDPFDHEIRSIRATYAQSGLYHNDGTNTPLWTIRYWIWTQEVFIAPDGERLVIASDDWFHSYDHVVSFFSNGRELASYSTTDLLSFARLKSLINGEPIDCGGMTFDADALTFTTRTQQGEAFTFDVTTGRLIRHWSPFPVFIAIGTATSLALLCLGVWIYPKAMFFRPPSRVQYGM